MRTAARGANAIRPNDPVASSVPTAVAGMVSTVTAAISTDTVAAATHGCVGWSGEALHEQRRREGCRCGQECVGGGRVRRYGEEPRGGGERDRGHARCRRVPGGEGGRRCRAGSDCRNDEGRGRRCDGPGPRQRHRGQDGGEDAHGSGKERVDHGMRRLGGSDLPAGVQSHHAERRGVSRQEGQQLTIVNVVGGQRQ